MRHKKQSFVRNEKKISLFANLYNSLLKFNGVLTITHRAKFLKKNLHKKIFSKVNKNVFINHKLIKNNLINCKNINKKQVRIIKKGRRKGDFSPISIIQLI